jgi:hypothetical protein
MTQQCPENWQIPAIEWQDFEGWIEHLYPMKNVRGRSLIGSLINVGDSLYKKTSFEQTQIKPTQL